MLNTIIDSIGKLLHDISNTLGADILFFLALAVEAVIVLFFLVKSLFSYEARLNRAIEKLNYWLFDRKNITEENIQELNMIFKTKVPKRLCYYWQQFILFREGSPSTYMSIENLVEKPLKTSSYESNIHNLTLISVIWAIVSSLFMIVASCFDAYMLGENFAIALCLPFFILLIGTVFVVYLRARKNSILNSLYQNTTLFGRFMDNACVDLPTYIDYQILFTPQEIESGQPVLREFLDYRARKEKEDFNKVQEEEIGLETYDFSSTGVDGSLVLDRAMRESEKFLKNKEKILVQISQLESEIESRRKNFDNVQKDYQTKIQASKENVERLRQMQEETTNRIESNYYRKQQTQEVAKQEQYEQEFEQQRTKYSLEKSECEEEIKKLNEELESHKNDVEVAMLSEYQTFFDKFCKSAEKVVEKAFEEKITTLKDESDKNQELVTQLQIQLKNKPEDAHGEMGAYDEKGNYVYEDGTFYDKDGHFHDAQGNVYTQDGKLISKPEQEENPILVDFDSFDAFDFMTDTTQKGDIYDVAEKVVDDLDKSVKVNNTAEKVDVLKNRKPAKKETKSEKDESKAEVKKAESSVKDAVQESLPQEEKAESEPAKPKKKVGRPRKIVNKTPDKETKKRGRPKKIVEKKAEPEKRKVGRPKKIVKEPVQTAQKRGRGRPRKESIDEINKKLSEEEKKIDELRSTLGKDLEKAMSDMNSNKIDDKTAKRDEIIKEIDKLQKEAQQAMNNKNADNEIAEINAKLEKMLEEIKKFN